MTATNPSTLDFETMVEISVREAVTRTLSDTVLKAMSFYFDPRQAATNPEAFASVIDNLFGSSSRVIQKVITETLLKKVGGMNSPLQSQSGRSFYDWIQVAKAKFASSANPMSRVH